MIDNLIIIINGLSSGKNEKESENERYNQIMLCSLPKFLQY